MELSLLAHKSSKYGFDIIAVSRHIKDFNVDLKELQKQFDKIAKQVERGTKSQSALELLFTSLISLFKVLFEMLNAQTKTIEQLNNTIESLQQKLGNKTVDSKRANDENINARGCEKKKIVESSDKNNIKATTKNKAPTNVDL